MRRRPAPMSVIFWARASPSSSSLIPIMDTVIPAALACEVALSVSWMGSFPAVGSASVMNMRCFVSFVWGKSSLLL